MTEYVVEYAKSGRASCKKCKNNIPKLALRVGASYESGGITHNSWHHIHCFKVPKAVKTGEREVAGGQLLDERDQDILERWVNGDELSPEDSVGRSQSAEAQPKTKPKRRKKEGEGEGEGEGAKLPKLAGVGTTIAPLQSSAPQAQPVVLLSNTSVVLGKQGGGYMSQWFNADGDEWLDVNQAQLTARHGGSVEVTVLGTNPSIAVRSGTPRVMNKGDMCLLHPGDILFLVGDRFPVVVGDKPPSKLASPQRAPARASAQSAGRSKAAPSSPPASKGNSGLLHFALCSVSTSTFQFDLQKAKGVFAEELHNFLTRCIDPSLRIWLVDTPGRQALAQLSKAYEDICGTPDPRFAVLEGSIAAMKTDHGIECVAVVNATNRKFKGGGSGTNKALHRAAGPDLEIDSVQKYKHAECGQAYPVKVRSHSTLAVQQGVRHVIHVLGPNMNPERPQCLNGDYEKGCRLLRAAYQNLFACFDSILRSHKQEPTPSSAPSTPPTPQQAHHPSAGSPLPAYSPPSTKPSTPGSWREALWEQCSHPERYPAHVFLTPGNCVVLYDAFPKARVHLLVLPRQRVRTLSVLDATHIPLVEELVQHASAITTGLRDQFPSLRFVSGFHSVPSMNQLHLHVISDDFTSPCMTKKKHWNSFTTAFFVPPRIVLDELRAKGKFERDASACERLLEQPLRCHICRAECKNMPRLTAHIATH